MNRVVSRKNNRVKEWRKLHNKKGRRQSGLFLVEGFHLVEEALKGHVDVMEIMIQEGIHLPRTWEVGRIPKYEMPEHVFQDLCETKHPQGVIAVCRKFVNDTSLEVKGRYLLIDAVRDPGNVGTMIRTADAAGYTGVILGEGCSDLLNGKVIRATQGSLFHLPVWEGNLHDWIDRFKEKGMKVFGTEPDKGEDYTLVDMPGHFALIVGNEANGVHQDILKKTDRSVRIPIYGESESLNVSVAAGILMYGLKRIL